MEILMGGEFWCRDYEGLMSLGVLDLGFVLLFLAAAVDHLGKRIQMELQFSVPQS
jgi:hypothetical protein